MTHSNLKPGVTESMLPGCSPRDEAFESWSEKVVKDLDEDILEYLENDPIADKVVDEEIEDNFDYGDPMNPSVLAEKINEKIREMMKEE